MACPGNRALQWLNFMTTVALLNLIVLVGILETHGFTTMSVCGALYVGACAFRSIVPQCVTERNTLRDCFPFSTAFNDRTVATVGELAFTCVDDEKREREGERQTDRRRSYRDTQRCRDTQRFEVRTRVSCISDATTSPSLCLFFLSPPLPRLVSTLCTCRYQVVLYFDMPFALWWMIATAQTVCWVAVRD